MNYQDQLKTKIVELNKPRYINISNKFHEIKMRVIGFDDEQSFVLLEPAHERASKKLAKLGY